jgi:hypothetical protein
LLLIDKDFGVGIARLRHRFGLSNSHFEKKSDKILLFTALPALMRYIFLLAPLLSSLSAFRMYLIAAGSAVNRELVSKHHFWTDNYHPTLEIDKFSEICP